MQICLSLVLYGFHQTKAVANRSLLPTFIKCPLWYNEYSQLSAIGRPVLLRKNAIGGYPDTHIYRVSKKPIMDNRGVSLTLFEWYLWYSEYSQLSAIGRPVLLRKNAIGGYPDTYTLNAWVSRCVSGLQYSAIHVGCSREYVTEDK